MGAILLICLLIQLQSTDQTDVHFAQQERMVKVKTESDTCISSYEVIPIQCFFALTGREILNKIVKTNFAHIICNTVTDVYFMIEHI